MTCIPVCYLFTCLLPVHLSAICSPVCYLFNCLSPVSVRVNHSLFVEVRLDHAHLLRLRLFSHLFVHEGVDEWVVDTWALGEKSRDSDKSIIFVFIWRVGEVKSSESIRTITGDEGTHHHDNHPWYFLLRLLGGDWLSLLGCNLNTRNNEKFNIKQNVLR